MVIKSKSVHSRWCYTTKRAQQEKKAKVYSALKPDHPSADEPRARFVTVVHLSKQNELVFEVCVF